MSDLWEFAFVALFAVIVAEAFAIFALARAIGILQIRLGPEPSALDTRDGLPVGSEALPVAGLELGFKRLSTLNVNERRWLLVFVSATCHICRDVVRDVGRISRDAAQSNTSVALIARGTHEQNEAFKEIAPRTVLISDSLGAVHDSYMVSTTPFAFLLHEGRVVAKGVVNSRDQLELLLDEERSTSLGESNERWTRISRVPQESQGN